MALAGVLLSSLAHAQTSGDLPPQVVPSLQAPADEDPRAGDGRSLDAIRLHLALGQRTEARQEAERFLRLYAVSKPTGAARAVLLIGTSLASAGDWQEVRSWMTRSMALIDRSAPVAEQVQAHALLGHSLAALHRVTEAEREYEQVRQRAAKLTGSFASATLEDDGLKTLGKALNALGEAHFYFAEKLRSAVDLTRPPAYRGGASIKDAQRFVATDLAAWVTRRRQAIVEAEKAYLVVLAVEPSPPPRWVVASAARVGLMWASLARAPRQVRLPPGVANDELRAAYLTAADALVATDRDRAKGSNETCLRLSVKYQQFDDFARSCEAWLERNFSREYPRNDVLGASPDRLTLGVPDRGAPLGRDGKQVATMPVWEGRTEAERPEELRRRPR